MAEQPPRSPAQDRYQYNGKEGDSFVTDSPNPPDLSIVGSKAAFLLSWCVKISEAQMLWRLAFGPTDQPFR